MAQVGVQQPTNLMEMFSSPSPMLWDIAQGQVNDQTLGNAINRAQAQQGMDFAAQEQPFKLDQLGLANQTARAQLPGFEADSGLKQNSLKRDTATTGDQIQATRAKLAKEVSDSDLAQAENAVKTAMTHPSAAVRAQAEEMSQHLYEIVKERTKLKEQQENALALENARGENARKLMQQQVDAGRFKKNDKFGISIAQKIDAENDPVKKAALLIDASKQAAKEGDAETADYYTQRASALENLVKAKLNANPRPGAVDVGQVGGVPVNPAATIMPAQQEAPAPKVQTPQDQIALQWARANPNDPRAAQILKKLGVK